MGLGPGTSRERVGEPLVIGADRRRAGPSFVLPKGVPHGKTETGGMVLAAMCWARAPRGGVTRPKEALYLPTFSHLLIVKKPLSLSLFLSLSCARAPNRSLTPNFSESRLVYKAFATSSCSELWGGKCSPPNSPLLSIQNSFFMSKLQKPPPSTPCFTAFLLCISPPPPVHVPRILVLLLFLIVNKTF